MQAQPDLAPMLAQNRRKIEAGAYRLDARYLLDAGQPGASLRSYSRALLNDPPYALRHWHRMAYAAASLVGLGGFVDRLLKGGTGRHISYPVSGEMAAWPGLSGDNRS